MKLYEISNAARKAIKRINSLYISYSVDPTGKNYNMLWDLIEKLNASADKDVKKQVSIYKTKLYEDLVDILKNNGTE
jgi:hypothetical protein